MTGAALTRYDGPTTLEDRRVYCELLAASGLLPDQFRRQAANVFYGIEYARMVDIPVLAAITGIHVISGKPSASAGLMTALVRRAGHVVRIRMTGTYAAADLAATCTVIRADDPDEPFVATWDVDRAIRAKLLRRLEDGRIVASKSDSGWDNYLEAMLKARATSEACREAAEEALYGIRYTPEELGANVDEDGEPTGQAGESAASAWVHADPPSPEPQPDPPAPDGIEDAHVVEDQPDPPAPDPVDEPPREEPPAAPSAPEQPEAGTGTPAGEQTASAPHAAPGSVLSSSITDDQLRAIADHALDVADRTKLLNTYNAAEDALKARDLPAGVPGLDPDSMLRAALNLPPDGPIAFGRLLVACGTYVNGHGMTAREAIST